MASSKVLPVPDVDTLLAAISVVVEWNEKFVFDWLICCQPCACTIPLIGYSGAATPNVRRHLSEQQAGNAWIAVDWHRGENPEIWQLCRNIHILMRNISAYAHWFGMTLQVLFLRYIPSPNIQGHGHVAANYCHVLRKCIHLVKSLLHYSTAIWCHKTIACSKGLGVPRSLW